MIVEFEAWYDRTNPIYVAAQTYKSTKTDVLFTILDADRNAVDLTGFGINFSAKKIDSTADTNLFDVACTIEGDPALGKAKAALSVANMADNREFLGDLSLRSSGPGGDIDRRVFFYFSILEGLVS